MLYNYICVFLIEYVWFTLYFWGKWSDLLIAADYRSYEFIYLLIFCSHFILLRTAGQVLDILGKLPVQHKSTQNMMSFLLLIDNVQYLLYRCWPKRALSQFLCSHENIITKLNTFVASQGLLLMPFMRLRNSEMLAVCRCGMLQQLLSVQTAVTFDASERHMQQE